jgi:hypothetical protein
MINNITEKNQSAPSNFIDRREHNRYSVHYLTDVYMGNEILFATVIDISESGIGIVLPGQFYKNEVLSLRISCRLLSHDKDSPESLDIRLRATVIWIKKEDNMYKAGLQIKDMAYRDLMSLKQQIQNLQGKAVEG